jgi:two-component SAPR family response regulator
MKVIIIDDEKAMHLIMRKQLAKIPDIEIVGMFQDTSSASFFIQDHVVHLAFVDISLSRESGMQFAKRMAEVQRNLHIVFVTSHKEYAMDAFDIFALDYIVKPVSLERLEKTVKRALSIHRFTEMTKDDKVSPLSYIYGLGGLEVRSGTSGSVKWISRKSAELFGYLLLHRGRMVSRVRLIADVFGGMPQKNAETYLNTIVYQLRKSLDAHGLKSAVKSDNDGYGLEMTNYWIDFVEFEERLNHYTEIDALNLDHAIETEALYVGDLFGEKAFLWALNDVERFSRKYTVFVKKLAAALLNNNDHSAAVRLLNKLFSYNPLDEESARLLLKAYALQKDKVSYNRLYERYSKILRKELGINPSRELAALYSRLWSEK